MLEKLIELLTALSVAVGAHGLSTAANHADPNADARAIAAVGAVIANLGTALSETTHGIALAATKVTNERALQALQDAAAAKAAGQAKAAAARATAGAGHASAPDHETPPVPAPPVTGRPGTTPPVEVPPVSIPDHP